MVFLYGSFVWGVLPHDPSISYEGHLSEQLVGFLLSIWLRKMEPIESLKDRKPNLEEDVFGTIGNTLWSALYTFEEIIPTPDTQWKRPQDQQFRYEDGSELR